MAKQTPLVEIPEQPTPTLSMHPKKFALWLFVVSVIMLFAGLTSGYIVRKAEGNWLEFDLPFVFYISTGIIVASSLTMHWAYLATKRDNFGSAKLAMLLTVVLGTAFLYTQWMGWKELVKLGIYFAGTTANPAGSFLYVLSGLHGVHIVSGLVFLFVVLFGVLKQQIHAKRMVRMEMCATYWHFLDVLWIYLLVFLLINGN